jgi:hypothetical protein
LPLWFFTGTADLLIRMSMGALAKRSSETVRNHRNAVRDGQESALKQRDAAQTLKNIRTPMSATSPAFASCHAGNCHP